MDRETGKQKEQKQPPPLRALICPRVSGMIMMRRRVRKLVSKTSSLRLGMLSN